jgi:hypothetical protein
MRFSYSRKIENLNLGSAWCISASGEIDCPLLLSTNRGVLVILDRGVRENIDLQIKRVNSPHMIGDTFIEYIRSILEKYQIKKLIRINCGDSK